MTRPGSGSTAAPADQSARSPRVRSRQSTPPRVAKRNHALVAPGRRPEATARFANRAAEAHCLRMLAGLDHVALTCVDVRRSAEWYGRVFELEAEGERVREANAPVALRVGAMGRIVLFAAHQPELVLTHPALRIDHFALRAETAGEFDALLCHARSLALSVEVQEHPESRSLYLRDPDGHVVEVVTHDMTFPA